MPRYSNPQKQKQLTILNKMSHDLVKAYEKELESPIKNLNVLYSIADKIDDLRVKMIIISM